MVQRVVALLSQVVIARIVGPSALGALAVAQALVIFGSILTDGGMTNSSMRRMVREPERRNQIATATLVAQAVLALAGVVVGDLVALVGPWTDRSAELIIALTPSLLCAAVNMTYVFNGLERMGAVAIYRAVASLLPAVGSVVAVGLTKNTLWVAVCTDAGTLIAAVLVWWHLRAIGVRLTRVSRAEVAAAARSGAPFLAIGVLLIIPPSSITVIVASVLGNKSAGIYSAAWQLTYAAITMSALVADAVLPEMVRRWDKDPADFRVLLATVLRVLCRILFPLATIVFFAAGSVVDLLYGADYATSATVLRITFLSVPFGYLWLFLGQALTAANYERMMLRRTAVITVMTLAAVWSAAELGDLRTVSAVVVALAVLQTLLYSASHVGGVRFAIGVVGRELPYAVVPAALCVAAELTPFGRGLGPTIVIAMAGTLACEALLGWPTLTGLRVARRQVGAT